MKNWNRWLWLISVLVVFVSSTIIYKKDKVEQIRSVEFSISSPTEMYLINEEDLKVYLYQFIDTLEQSSKTDVSLFQIERILKENSHIKSVEAYFDRVSNINIDVDLKQPLLRYIERGKRGFYISEDGVPNKIKSTELFDNQKAILIGVPGAFTKVCSAKHLPGYVENFEEAKKKGITKIICISVNDPNVMKAWGEDQKVENKIFMAADPYCQFTKSIGADIDRTDKGLGVRSARYTMLIENNVVKVIKEEEDTGTCEISAAENFIKNI